MTSLKFSKQYTNEEIEKIKESGSDKEREELAVGLWRNKDFDTLKTMINDSYGRVRHWVTWGLYDNKDFDTLKTMINDGYWGVRRQVAEGLCDSKDYDTLKTMIDDSDEVVREWVAKGLYDNKDYDTLKTMINDGYWGVRRQVARSLYNNEDYDTLKTMINDSDDGVRKWVGVGLVDTEDWNTLEKFLEKEENAWVKDEVEQGIADKILEKHFGSLKFSKQYTHEEIEKIKESGSGEERINLAIYLYDNKDYDTLKTMVNDSDEEVRYYVARSLCDNKDYDTLKTMVNDSDEDVREWVAKGLWRNKDYDTLKTMIDDSDDYVRYLVAEGLLKNKDYDTLKTMINDSDGSVRYYVGLGLVEIEDWNTLQEFLEKEKDENVKDRIEQEIADKILEKHFGSNEDKTSSYEKSILKFSQFGDYTQEEIDNIIQTGRGLKKTRLAEYLRYNKDINNLKRMIDDKDADIRLVVGKGLVDAKDWNTLNEFLEKEEVDWIRDEIGIYIGGQAAAPEHKPFVSILVGGTIHNTLEKCSQGETRGSRLRSSDATMRNLQKCLEYGLLDHVLKGPYAMTDAGYDVLKKLDVLDSQGMSGKYLKVTVPGNAGWLSYFEGHTW